MKTGTVRLPMNSIAVVGVGVLFQAVIFGASIYSFTFYVVPWGEDYGVSRATIMMASVVLSLGSGLVGPFAGYLLDRFSYRVVVVSGMVSYAIGMIIAGVSHYFWQVIAAYALFIGPALTLAGPLAAQVLVTRTIEESRRGLAFGWVLTGTSLGGVFVPPVVAFVIETVGWRAAIIGIGPVGVLLVGPLVWLTTRQLGTGKTKRSSEATETAHRDWLSWDILLSLEFWVPIAIFIPAMAAFVAVQYNLGPFAHEMGLQPTEASLMMSIVAAMMIASKVFFGYLSDRVPHAILCFVSLIGLVGALLMFSSEPQFQGMIFACSLLGLSSGSFLPLIAAMLAKQFGVGAFGRAMGLALPFLTVAGFGGLIAGWVYDEIGSYATVFRMFALSAIAGGLVALGLALIGRSMAAIKKQPEIG